jgi:hypothetical protein
MNVHLNLKDQSHVEIVRIYGPHSISVELVDEWGRVIADMDDEGSSGSVTLSLAEAAQLRQELISRSVSEPVLSGPFRSGRRGRLEPA